MSDTVILEDGFSLLQRDCPGATERGRKVIFFAFYGFILTKNCHFSAKNRFLKLLYSYTTTYLVSKEEHDCTGVVQFVHCIEFWHFGDVDEVGDCKIFHFICG
jgi:hypothetical protein